VGSPLSEAPEGGHAPGSALEERVRAIEDRTAILAMLHQYCAMVDRLDAHAIAQCFTEDCVLDFGPGLGGEQQGRALVEHILATGLRRYAATSHHLSNATITLAGDRATGVSHVLAWHRMADGKPDVWLFGQYHDRFVREPDRWRIAERRLLAAGEIGFPVAWAMIPRLFRPDGPPEGDSGAF
jgi:ketosteroid isomerase-like protein